MLASSLIHHHNYVKGLSKSERPCVCVFSRQRSGLCLCLCVCCLNMHMSIASWIGNRNPCSADNACAVRVGG